MDTRELLDYLTKIESGLENFSYAELKSQDAAALKASFNAFKNGLESRVFGDVETVPRLNLNNSNKANQTNETDLHLVANVSHEIRTPLNSIMGFLDLLKDTGLDTRQLELVKAMDVASNSMFNLVNELLEFSKIATGHETYEQVSFKPKNVIDEVAFLCKTLINQKNEVKFSLNYDSGIPEILIGDPAKLSQVLLNLIGNAIKFVEKGSINLTVKLKEDRSKKVFLEFVVADTGIGIANDQLKHIFESYRQADQLNHKKYGGSGLGLSIIKAIIEQQMGCIAVSSQLGMGTTFNVILPYQKASLMAANIQTQETKQTGVSIAGANILVVEDDFLSRKLMESRLKQQGGHPFLAENKEECLYILKTEKIDLILMDMRLPDTTGVQLAKDIQIKVDGPQIPIILLSADIQACLEESYKDYGIVDFMLKPCKTEELLTKIDQYINNDKKESNNPELTLNNLENKPLVDLESLFNECLQKPDLLEELVTMLKNNVVEFIGKTKVHLIEENYSGIGFAAHKIKSSLKMVKANGLLNYVEQIQDFSNNTANLEGIKTQYACFIEAYKAVEVQIDKELARLLNGK